MLHPDELVEHGFVRCKLARVNGDQIPNRPFLILKKLFELSAEYARYNWPRGITLATIAFQRINMLRWMRVLLKLLYEVSESLRRFCFCRAFLSHETPKMVRYGEVWRTVFRVGFQY